MKNRLLIIVVTCLLALNILLLNNNYKQAEIIKNNHILIADKSRKLTIDNDSLKNEIAFLYHNKVSDLDLNAKIYNNYKQEILWAQFPTEKLVVVIPESICTPCFYHIYENMLETIEPSLKGKFCLVKNVKEISRAILDDTEGVEFYIEGGFGLGIEKYNCPYILNLDENFGIEHTFFFDTNHPTTFINVIKYYKRKQNENNKLVM